MKKRISILGSTGSIGTQTVDVLDSIDAQVTALTTNKNIDLIEKQARKLNPQLVVAFDEKQALKLKISLADTNIKVESGMEGLIHAACLDNTDVVVTAVVGMVGLLPTIAAIEAGHDIALANKETLVCAGSIIMDYAKKNGVNILPIDSEHSAIFQCVQAAHGNKLHKIILTASGGPFFGKKYEDLKNVTVSQALNHPNWSMGSKITIDSATMFNKGLELIEAMWLYNMPQEKIEIVVHRESIIHSLIEFEDGAVLAQLDVPDMRLPIQYALTYPKRFPCKMERLNLSKIGKMTFYSPDEKTFNALSLARKTARLKGNMGAVMNGANEEAVNLFLREKIGFIDISRLVEMAMEKIEYKKDINIDDVIMYDKQARELVNSSVRG